MPRSIGLESKFGKAGAIGDSLRGLPTGAVLFGSKLVILKAINITFGKRVLFGGPVQSLIAFVMLVVATIVAEVLVYRVTLCGSGTIIILNQSPIYQSNSPLTHDARKNACL